MAGTGQIFEIEEDYMVMITCAHNFVLDQLDEDGTYVFEYCIESHFFMGRNAKKEYQC